MGALGDAGDTQAGIGAARQVRGQVGRGRWEGLYLLLTEAPLSPLVCPGAQPAQLGLVPQERKSVRQDQEIRLFAAPNPLRQESRLLS